MSLSLDLVKVGWGAAVTAEGRKLPTTSEELLSRLISSTIWVYYAVPALDPK